MSHLTSGAQELLVTVPKGQGQGQSTVGAPGSEWWGVTLTMDVAVTSRR